MEAYNHLECEYIYRAAVEGSPQERITASGVSGHTDRTCGQVLDRMTEAVSDALALAPEDLRREYGSDCLRLYLLFMGPGREYQQGTLFGYELREYLLEHFRHTCQYCGGASGDSVLEWEHKIPKSRGGTDSIKNATLSCFTCNRDKGSMTPGEWLEYLKSEESGRLAEIRIRHLENMDTVYGSNRYSAWTNTLRKKTEKELFDIFGEVECSSGGKTKYNREKILKLPKDHHIDALAVGSVPPDGYIDCTNGYILHIKAMGRGTRLRGLINECGIINVKWTDRRKRFNGLQTGDIVRVYIPNGK